MCDCVSQKSKWWILAKFYTQLRRGSKYIRTGKKTQPDIQPSLEIKIKECIVSQDKFTKLVAVFFCCGDVF